MMKMNNLTAVERVSVIDMLRDLSIDGKSVPFTVAELVKRAEKRLGRRVSPTSIRTQLHACGLTCRKDQGTPMGRMWAKFEEFETRIAALEENATGGH